MSRRLLSTIPLLAFALAAAALAPRAEAQSARRLRGPWVALQAGAGSASLSCEACVDQGRRIGPTAGMAVGYAFSSRLALTGEIDGWVRPSGGREDHFGAFSATLQAFPSTTAGLYLTGGIGLARFRSLVGRPDGGSDRTTTSGLALSLGAGYDLPIGREVSLAPAVTWYRGLSGELRMNDFRSGIDVTHSMLQTSLGLYWHLPQRW